MWFRNRNHPDGLWHWTSKDTTLSACGTQRLGMDERHQEWSTESFTPTEGVCQECKKAAGV